MDIYGLAITHIRTAVRPVRMSAWAEDRYYSNQMDLRRLNPGLRGSIAIAAGLTLAVSVNTLRTQLQRIFDKTGVRSQAALVRSLLSVEAPNK